MSSCIDCPAMKFLVDLGEERLAEDGLWSHMDDGERTGDIGLSHAEIDVLEGMEEEHKILLSTLLDPPNYISKRSFLLMLAKLVKEAPSIARSIGREKIPRKIILLIFDSIPCGSVSSPDMISPMANRIQLLSSKLDAIPEAWLNAVGLRRMKPGRDSVTSVNKEESCHAPV